MRAIAIDDERPALEVVKSHCARVDYVDLVCVFSDVFKALEFLQENKVDLIFLDIEMPAMSGFGFFSQLEEKPLLILTTAYSKHATMGFDFDAVDYLLKPFTFSRFEKSCEKAREVLNYKNRDGADFFFVKSGYEQIKVFYEDILFIEGAGNYISFNLTGKKVLTRSTFSEVTKILPRDKFIRIYRSYIVSLRKIDKVEKYEVTVDNFKLPVSGTYWQDLVDALDAFRG